MGNPKEKLAALLVAAARQDRRAFAEFYALTSSLVYGMICEMTVAPDHDDVMQEVFVLAWQRAAEYDPVGEGALAWIMALAHCHAVDQARKGTTSPSAGFRSTPHPSTEWDGTGSMHGLPSSERESIMMAYGGGMTYQRVAESLGVAEETIRGRIRDGVRSLNNNPSGDPHDEH